jgi:two-component system catabolic regulation response regulator CreB
MNEVVLVIEDERPIADTVVYALEREGFAPKWCPTGEEGLQALNEDDPTMIIMDIGLPDRNGLDLCREIRQQSNIPIIFLSARNEELDRILGLELGGDDYVTKPFSPRELVARVRSVLRRHNAGGAAPLTPIPETDARTIGPFEEDTEQMRIRFHAQNLELSLYEYRLLSLLLSRPKKVFSREEILNRAWDEPEMTTDRTVDAHIKSIRKKLKEVKPDDDPIRTVRGVGYAMDIEN